MATNGYIAASLAAALALALASQTRAQTAASYTFFETAAPGYGEGRDWSIDEFTRQIGGRTFLKRASGGNEVMYFSPDKAVFTWATGDASIATALWKIEKRQAQNTSPPALFVCTTLPGRNGQGAIAAGQYVLRCMEAPGLFNPRVDRADGDVFGIRRAGPPPFPLPKTATTISALRR